MLDSMKGCVDLVKHLAVEVKQTRRKSEVNRRELVEFDGKIEQLS